MLQDEKDTKELQKIMLKNYDFLKRLHIDFLSSNQLPYANVMDYLEFSKKCCFADQKLVQA